MSGGFAYGKIAKAICGRCQVRYPYTKLMADGNSPGLRVCKDCRDEIDPYKLAPRQPDSYVLKFPRPDVNIAIQPYASNWDSSELFWDEEGLFWDYTITP